VSMMRTSVLLAICYTVLVLVVYVVVIGGIICLKDEEYNFAEYLADLQGIYKLLATGVVSGIAHEYFSRNGRMKVEE
jgi:hypothetical protein